MKKLLLILLCVIFILPLTACGTSLSKDLTFDKKYYASTSFPFEEDAENPNYIIFYDNGTGVYSDKSLDIRSLKFKYKFIEDDEVVVCTYFSTISSYPDNNWSIYVIVDKDCLIFSNGTIYYTQEYINNVSPNFGKYYK